MINYSKLFCKIRSMTGVVSEFPIVACFLEPLLTTVNGMSLWKLIFLSAAG